MKRIPEARFCPNSPLRGRIPAAHRKDILPIIGADLALLVVLLVDFVASQRVSPSYHAVEIAERPIECAALAIDVSAEVPFDFSFKRLEHLLTQEVFQSFEVHDHHSYPRHGVSDLHIAWLPIDVGKLSKIEGETCCRASNGPPSTKILIADGSCTFFCVTHLLGKVKDTGNTSEDRCPPAKGGCPLPQTVFVLYAEWLAPEKEPCGSHQNNDCGYEPAPTIPLFANIHCVRPEPYLRQLSQSTVHLQGGVA